MLEVWDHFFRNSVIGQGLSTHYVNVPHCREFQPRPKISLEDQHPEFGWFDQSVVANYKVIQDYISSYSFRLFDNIGNRYD